MTSRPPGLLDPPGVAELTGLSITTIHIYNSTGRLPKPDFRFGSVPVWKKSTIDRWIRTR